MAEKKASDTENQFPIPGATFAEGRGSKYYTEVEKSGPNKGQITIKKRGGILGDPTIGTMPPGSPIRMDIGATEKELEYFQSADGQKKVRDQAITSLVNRGSSQTEAQQLIRPGTTTTPLVSNIPPQEGTGGGAPGAGTTPPDGTSTPLIDPEKLSRVSGINVRTNYGSPRDLRYPSNINAGKDKQDVIQFTMHEYTPPNSFTSEISNTFNKRSQLGSPRGTVTLPIQPTIVDSNSVNWQQDSINPMELAGLDMAQGFINDGAGGLQEALGRVTASLGAGAGDAKNVVIAALISAAINKNIVQRTTGAILNPNVELLFNGPSLRVFNYSFKLSARSGPESKNIQRIIRFFKQGMSVQRSEAELFLVTPDIFTIRYLFKEGPDHPYINRIKVCALTNCSVDYTPTGSYMTFQDGAMVSYTMNLTFEELEPVYHDDYDELEENQIGF